MPGLERAAEQGQGHPDAGVVRREFPANLDEARHQRRCEDPDCAQHEHEPYRDRYQQRYEPPVEPGDPDWSVVWGYTHLVGPPVRRLAVTPSWVRP